MEKMSEEESEDSVDNKRVTRSKTKKKRKG